ncbi:microsomal glutathione S-transferase 1-like [Anastrepha ludens]|uniref:microsomal glutathione S-transferase 1-like n=1 Tax=Anastrepha ludens TaxID=28586 RepID=UPI0023B1D24A|nr:microsomal glutathione S-transferase 1-like [Anastrepha ludens]
MEVVELLSLDNDVFACFAFWMAMLVLKMIVVALLTSIKRLATKTFVNPEDFVDKRIKLKFDDPEVERLRRVHRNDLENILPFFVVGILYVLFDPSPVVAINMFRAVAISRLAHTYIYIYAKPQPARFIAYLGAVVPMIYISLMVIYCSF